MNTARVLVQAEPIPSMPLDDATSEPRRAVYAGAPAPYAAPAEAQHALTPLRRLGRYTAWLAVLCWACRACRFVLHNARPPETALDHLAQERPRLFQLLNTTL